MTGRPPRAQRPLARLGRGQISLRSDNGLCGVLPHLWPLVVPDKIGEQRKEDFRIVIPFYGHFAERRSGEAAHFPEFALEKGGEFLGGRSAASEPRRERKVFGCVGDSLGMLGVGIEEVAK